MAGDPRSALDRLAYIGTVMLLVAFCLFCLWFYLASCGLVITL